MDMKTVRKASTEERNLGTARQSTEKWSSQAEPQKERSRFCGKESEGTRAKAIE
jgi:hypothetical protein